MDQDCYRFMVGEIECFAINDGTGIYSEPQRFLFDNAPPDELGPALQKYNLRLNDWQEWTSPHLCLALRTGGRCLLVDTGYGKTAGQPRAGKLLQNLQAAGLRPADIDTVILTHAHADHLGGVTDADGKLVFENARHVMWRTEWEFWNSQPGRQESDAWQKLAPLAGRIHLIDRETEVAPGVRLLPAAGHTPGHAVVSVVSGGGRLLHISDTFTHPLHLEHPDWNMRLDRDPQAAAQTRRRLFEQAAAEGTLLMAYHFDFPGLGHILKDGAAWKWQPLALNAPRAESISR